MMHKTGSGLLVPVDDAAAERLRMASVAAQTRAKLSGPSLDAAVSDAINGAAGQSAADPGDVWRGNLARGLGAFQLMEGVRRKAFLAGIDFAASTIQLAAVLTEAKGAPSAAAAFRHLAAEINGNAINMGGMSKNKVTKRRR